MYIDLAVMIDNYIPRATLIEFWLLLPGKICNYGQLTHSALRVLFFYFLEKSPNYISAFFDWA